MAHHATRNSSAEKLLAGSTARRVTFAHGNRALDDLLIETGGKCGVYIFEARGRVLRIGQSVDLGARLTHHRETGYRPYKGFAHYHDFFSCLIDQRLTIRWVESHRKDLDRVEHLLIGALDPLWESLKRARDFQSVRQLFELPTYAVRRSTPTQTRVRSRRRNEMTRVRPPLSEAEAARIGYNPNIYRTCPVEGFVVQDIRAHHAKHHGGPYSGVLRDADDPEAQKHLRIRRFPHGSN